MTGNPSSSDPRKPSGRVLGWVSLIVGILLCLGILSSVANGSSTTTSGAAETAGLVIGRLIVLAIGVAGIVFGVRRIRR